jgi:hypothetical protein
MLVKRLAGGERADGDEAVQPTAWAASSAGSMSSQRRSTLPASSSRAKIG